MVYFFLVITLVISCNVRRHIALQAKLSYNKKILEATRLLRRALRKLWIVTGSFLVVGTYMLVYDFFIYVNAKATKSCDILIKDSFAANEALWFVTRSIKNYLWVVPVVYVFWPSIVKNGKKQ